MIDEYKDKKELRQELNIEIGKRCRTARKEANLTQEQLGNYLDVNSQFISDVERGVVGISLLTLKDISNALGVTADYLINGTDNGITDYCIKLGNRSIFLSKEEYDIMEQHINIMLRALKYQEELDNDNYYNHRVVD